MFNSDVDEMGYVDLSDLHISLHLLTQLKDWDVEFQQTFSDDYPPDSGFKFEEDRNRHNERGTQLAALLEQELGTEVRVNFIPLK
ncbi:hypothetical protein [Paraburkholderia megapolitana]|uniref:Uncharacterized protein n=1 Tax=Paraburkholderia megapolitana TaxID=420953 RepID=A0A1I3IYX4_9BURK|nr:hypothetical protein [Paraburkholderia megapolitana]QDQ84989.1 hypothetical protein FNZ07_28555 [Paraburkholderia megapolitana]SFI53184.1 hypothetical protein SAMN05192543_103483 [Paraburkholderia megapolitana]